MLEHGRAFGAVGGGLRRFQQRKGAKKLHGAVIFDPQRVGLTLHTVVFGAAGVQRQTRRIEAKALVFAELRKTFAQFFGDIAGANGNLFHR